MSAFSEWVDKGYQGFVARKEKTYGSASWRFWARGIKRDHLICGVIKDSSDSLGRPYPLLIMGNGTIKGWEKGWVCLFQTFKQIWDQMEYTSSKRFDRLDQLENAVQLLQKPLEEGASAMPKVQSGLLEEQAIRTKALQLNDSRELWVPLNEHTAMDPFSTAEMWSASLAQQGCQTPNALFTGGIPERHYLTLIHRSLNMGDFINLWSLDEKGKP